MAHYLPTSKSLHSGRISLKPLYWYQHIESADLDDYTCDSEKDTFGILGYQCDEGVRRNQGRVGASVGPSSIRNMMGSMSWHAASDTEVLDFGNVVCDDIGLENAHDLIIVNVSKMLNKDVFPILLGGGHDLAYPHFKALRKAVSKKKKIGIVNLDAHFDLREIEQERTSGTPFYQILEEDEEVDYCCFGIQKPANNADLFDYATAKNVTFLFSEEFNLPNWNFIQKKLDLFLSKVDYLYLTIDLDGFSSAFAPGVSAPSPVGFFPDVVFKVLERIKASGKLTTTDIVELNPRYDIDHCTARLAARLVEKLIVPIH